jgi:exodeoxyribonuclease VII large subunit
MGADANSALGISEITAHIKGLLESAIGTVWVTGEVSNFRKQASGHCYFTLKDDSAQLRCVMWRTTAARTSALPQDGMQVIARGNLTVYEPYGQHQLVVGYVQPAGIGSLQAAFEALKTKLAAEGLFDEGRKRSIPRWPKVVGVVTSGTGAAVRDIINVVSRRMPTSRLIVRPTVVQGEKAAADIVEAIRQLNEHGESEVLIVGRGGGSLEDLWAFNEEPVVRAIVASRTPVISAVGHEIDYTLSDFAADHRSPTPSAAAEEVIPDVAQIRQFVATSYRDLGARLREQVERAADKYSNVWGLDAVRRINDRIDRHSQDVDRHTEAMGRRAERSVAHGVNRFRTEVARLEALSPLQVLSRGFAVAEKEDGSVITDATSVDPKDRFRVRLDKGIILGIVDSRLGG